MIHVCIHTAQFTATVTHTVAYDTSYSNCSQILIYFDMYEIKEKHSSQPHEFL